MKTAIATLTAGALFAATTSISASVIYEGFVDDTNAIVTGNDTGIGLSGTWSQNDGAHSLAAGLSYGSLAVSGNSAAYNGGGRSGQSASIPTATLSDEGLLSDTATLWFSVLVSTTETFGSNSRWMMSLGTGTLHSGNQGMSGSGSGIGFVIDGNGSMTSATWSSGSISKQDAQSGAVSNGSTTLVVGKITWGATTDTIDLYLPGIDLVQPVDAASSGSANLSQSGFNVLAFAGKDKSQFDEIRFGTSYADVTPVPEPGSLALLGLGGLMMIKRRRRG